MEVSLNGRKVGPGHPTYIVAEIGQNHNGDVYQASRLIGVAAEAGVDAVKFCKRHIPSELTRRAHRKPYDNPHSYGRTYGEHREALELSIEDYSHLRQRIQYNEWPVTMFATACDFTSVDELEEWGNPFYKIASRDLMNLPLIEYVASMQKPVILSTGMGDVEDIDAAIETVMKYHDQLVILECTSQYPTPIEEVDLFRMQGIGMRHQVAVGLSDHTIGAYLAPVVAVILGASVIEKHITFSRASRGTDHAGSVEPEGLRRMVRDIRHAETLTSVRERVHHAPERTKLGRSLVTSRPIAAGEVIGPDCLILKSPGDGLPWSERYALIGHAAKRELPADVTLQPGDVV